MEMAAHSAHQGHRGHSKWLLGGMAGLGALTLAPYALPLEGVQSAVATDSYMHFLGGHGDGLVYGTGLAGGLTHLYSQIPLIGGALTSTAPVAVPIIGSIATGALVTIGATAIIGIGGMFLANWMEKRESPDSRIRWSKIIRVAALSTSLLIALPSILGGISLGLMFMAGIISSGFASHVGVAMRSSLGATAMADGASGLMAMAPHIFSCGFALLPASLAMYFSGRKPQQEASDESRYACELVSHSACTKGVPCTLDFQVVDTTTGKTLGPDELATMHTKKLHTMIVDSGLTDYHHIHPQYDAARRMFSCSFTPNLEAPYAMWNDFTVARATQPTQVKTNISVGRNRPIAAHITPSNATQVGDLTFCIAPDSLLRQGQSSMLTLDITGPDGHPVTDLQPIMGAYAHLAGFSADGQHFIHSHPIGAEPKSEDERGIGHLQFHITPAMAGMNKFFLQVERQGHTITVPFGQRVAPALGFANRVQNESHSHAGMAMA